MLKLKPINKISTSCYKKVSTIKDELRKKFEIEVDSGWKCFSFLKVRAFTKLLIKQCYTQTL